MLSLKFSSIEICKALFNHCFRRLLFCLKPVPRGNAAVHTGLFGITIVFHGTSVVVDVAQVGVLTRPSTVYCKEICYVSGL